MPERLEWWMAYVLFGAIAVVGSAAALILAVWLAYGLYLFWPWDLLLVPGAVVLGLIGKLIAEKL